MVRLLWKTVSLLLKKLKHTITILHSDSTPGYQPKVKKAGPQRGSCKLMCTAALPQEPKGGSKLSVHPSPNEWINKMWYTHTMNYHSALKRKAILTHAPPQI